jgi:hypothetical protein
MSVLLTANSRQLCTSLENDVGTVCVPVIPLQVTPKCDASHILLLFKQLAGFQPRVQ